MNHMTGRSRVKRDGLRLRFRCPGCGEDHSVSISGSEPRWSWNGDERSPTLSPSVLVRSGHHAPQFKAGDSCWCTLDAEQIAAEEPVSGFKCTVCHSFVRDGRIQFLDDCTHPLTGQTVDLPPYDEVDLEGGER